MHGTADPLQPPFEATEFRDVAPVTGAGYALLRIGDRAMGVGGPRGEGWVAFFADGDPAPQLVLAALRWLAARA